MMFARGVKLLEPIATPLHRPVIRSTSNPQNPCKQVIQVQIQKRRNHLAFGKVRTVSNEYRVHIRVARCISMVTYRLIRHPWCIPFPVKHNDPSLYHSKVTCCAWTSIDGIRVELAKLIPGGPDPRLQTVNFPSFFAPASSAL
jgi:hypothetical protein